MQYIHERSDWPHWVWDGGVLSAMLAALRFREGHLVGRMQGLGMGLRQEASLRSLTRDVVGSSAIEGENLDALEVRSSIARQLGMDVGGLKTSTRDVDGVVEMLLDATQHFDKPLTAERLFGWHAALFPTGRSGLRKIAVGTWRSDRTGAMQVVSGPIGKEIVHFEAPAASRLAAEMTRFLEWFNASPELDPIIKAGIAHFWFVTIHPFEDGNGRIARAIADMMLARADTNKERFYSMSSQIEAERRAYYEQLEAQQRNGLNITPWLRWFLGCLGRAFDTAEGVLEAVLYKARIWDKANRNGVNERQRKVLGRMLDDEWEGYMTTSKYARLAKTSQDTALRDIQELLAGGVLIRNPGGGRSTSYRLAEAGEL